jgi:hypothetical protein
LIGAVVRALLEMLVEDERSARCAPFNSVPPPRLVRGKGDVAIISAEASLAEIG